MEEVQAHRTCKYFKGKYFQFSVLPFGLLSPPYVFSTLMQPWVKLSRSNGLNAVMYGICVHM